MTRVEQIQSQSPDAPAASRRQLITSLIAGGVVIAASPVFAGTASGATSDIPKNDERDNPTLNSALERESRMAATYALAVEAVSSEDDKAALLLIHDNHVAYVDALRGYLATNAQTPTGQPLANPTGSFNSIASLLSGLEDETVNIHTNSLTGLIGMNAAALVASIITVEARQAAALALVSGSSALAAARV
jgi:hypothetical protein